MRLISKSSVVEKVHFFVALIRDQGRDGGSVVCAIVLLLVKRIKVSSGYSLCI